jgi:type II secretory pathway predicted ATPase ExeA
MIHEYYGLRADAFALSPDLEFLYVSEAHEETLAHLVYGLEQNEDITLIIGDIGTGKTLALHRLLEQLSKTFVPVYITVTQLDFEQLLKLVLLNLDVAIDPRADLAVLLHTFEKHLIECRKLDKRVLLVVDEAQNLPCDSLESLRMLMNLAQPGISALQLVLVGQLDLRENLSLPSMRQLRQRIRVEYELDFLSRDETEAYLMHRLSVAGREDKLFSKSAFDRIYEYSGGVPRLVNHIANKAILNGYVATAGTITGRHVEPFSEGLGSDERHQNSRGVDLEPVETKPLKAVSGREDKHTQRNASRGIGKKATMGIIILVALLLLGFFSQDNWRPLLAGFNSADVDNEFVVSDNPIPRGGFDAESIPASSANVNSSIAENTNPDSNPAAEVRTNTTLYWGHIASFRAEGRATNFHSMMMTRGYSADVRQKQADNGGNWFRVYLGPFEVENDATRICSDLKSEGVISYFLVFGEPNETEQ